MLFNSYEYIFFFLPITFIIYFYLLHKRLTLGARGFLVFASLFFYSWWNPIYLPIILASMLFNYKIGNMLNQISVKINPKVILTFGILANIALLGYFKYIDFFIENINYLTDKEISLYHFALPLGISFFTFQQISYLVDSYRKETKEYDLLNYALFVTFFPQLIAGPIVHHKEMMPQFENKYNLVKNYKNIAIGLFIFSIGLFKKVVIADNFAVWASNGFDKAEYLNMIEAWATSLSYTFQLYFDFSGYTDMAIGAALLFNIKLPINFNSPYKARNIQDFWRRWHITLSNFLRDYIYFPLGGSKVIKIKIYRNLLVTFILGGLWHGASWMFVFWGFLHGFALVIHRIFQNLNLKLNLFFAWFLTFNFINISWIFFRAKDLDDAMKVLKSMFFGDFILPDKYAEKLSFLHSLGAEFGYVFEDIAGKNKTLTFLVLAFIITLKFKNSMELRNSFKPTLKNLIIGLAMLFIALSMMSNVSEFLYFNF